MKVFSWLKQTTVMFLMPNNIQVWIQKEDLILTTLNLSNRKVIKKWLDSRNWMPLLDKGKKLSEENSKDLKEQ